MEKELVLPPNFQEEMMNCEMNFQSEINETNIRKLIYVYTLGMQYYNLKEKEDFENYYRNKLNNLLLDENVIKYLDTHEVDLSKKVDLNIFPKDSFIEESPKKEENKPPVQKKESKDDAEINRRLSIDIFKKKSKIKKDDIIESYIHSLSGKTVIIDSVYYDSEMKNEIRQFPITINENTALYYNFHEVNNDVHRHSYKSVVTKKATPTATGVRTFTCTVCGATKTETIAKCAKYANPISAKGKTATVKLANLKKKNQTILQKNAFAISKAQGKVTFKKASGNKKITVVKSGKITVKKGLKKGTYKVKVKVTAAGNANYKALAKTVTVVIKVK